MYLNRVPSTILTFGLLSNLTTEAFSPKGRLFTECHDNSQCHTAYSYCGWGEQNNYATETCICKDGYLGTLDALSCIPIQICSNAEFNHPMTQDNCPSDKQFCRENICLCVPGYAYNQDGECVWNVPSVLEPGTDGSITPTNVLLFLLLVFLILAVVFMIYTITCPKRGSRSYFRK